MYTVKFRSNKTNPGYNWFIYLNGKKIAAFQNKQHALSVMYTLRNQAEQLQKLAA